MRRVSLLAPDVVVRRELAGAYGRLVTDSLLRSWQARPATAPGSEVSNPWPARIDIRSVESERAACTLQGNVVYVTSADTTSVVERRPVTMRAQREGGEWRVSSYEPASASEAKSPATGSSGVAAQGAGGVAAQGAGTSAVPADTTPAGVVRRYYLAIDARDYDAAYALWGDDAGASRDTPSQLARGYAETAQVGATIGDGIRIEGAAGSQYATVPVEVNAVLRDGRRQRFTGTYTLRRSMVDGATPEQRRWHITAASLHAR